MYAAIELDRDSKDPLSQQRNSDLLKKEVSKPKAKPDVVRELIKRTLHFRRNLVLEGGRPESIISDFPHLKKATYVSVI